MLLLLDPIGAMATTDIEKLNQLIELVDVDSSGLMEAIAGLSRKDLIETAELTKDSDDAASEMLNYFAFGDHRIPMTDDELAELEKRYEAYVEKNGTYYGFPGEVLGL